MVRPFWFARTEIFQNKRNVSRGSPKFPNGISERKMCLPFAIRNQFQAIRHFLSASRGLSQHGCCWEFCFPLCKNFEVGFGHSKVRSELSDCVRRHHNLTQNQRFSSDLSSWKLQWLILSGILHLPHNREAARSNYSSIEAPIVSLNTTISAAILKMSKSP